jgi:hypothetical protein
MSTDRETIKPVVEDEHTHCSHCRKLIEYQTVWPAGTVVIEYSVDYDTVYCSKECADARA